MNPGVTSGDGQGSAKATNVIPGLVPGNQRDPIPTAASSCSRHGLIAQEALHGGDAEGSVGGAVACVVASALHYLEKEPFAERFGVGLQEFPAPIAVVKK